MKCIPSPVLGLLFFGAVFVMPGLGAPTTPATSATPTDKYKTKTEWPGVSFIIAKVKRVDEQNVVFKIAVSADATAPVFTFLGSWPGGKNYALDPNGKKIPVQPSPYSMMDSTVVDKLTNAAYKPVPIVFDFNKPYYGMSEVLKTIHPKEWFQMAIKVPVPQPPPNSDGKIPVQKVDVTLPQGKEPIKNVVIPPLSP